MDNELIERIKEIAYRDSAKSVTVRADDLRELLKLIAQPADPVTTQEPVAWLVVSPDELEPVKGVAHSQEFADKYRSTGWSVTPLYTHADASEVERLRAEVERLRKDAERYRFLRDGERGGLEYWDGELVVCDVEDTVFGPALDGAVDNAIDAMRERIRQRRAIQFRKVLTTHTTQYRM